MKTILVYIIMCFVSLSVYAQAQVKDRSYADKQVHRINKVVPLSESQKTRIKSLNVDYKSTTDSITRSISNSEDEYQKKYDAAKAYHENLMKTLTESQIASYVRTTCAPEIKAKTEYRISLLREGGDYTEDELSAMYSDIYNYLMLEKIVYFRYKYDFATQKNNISRLKAIQPNALKESQTIEKQKGLGKVRTGDSWK